MVFLDLFCVPQIANGLEHAMDITSKVTFTTQEAATFAGISRSSIYMAIRSQNLVARNVGDRTIILRTDLDDWLAILPKANLGEAKR